MSRSCSEKGLAIRKSAVKLHAVQIFGFSLFRVLAIIGWLSALCIILLSHQVILAWQTPKLLF